MTTHTTNVDFVLTELNATKILTWNFHVDDLWKHSRYNMIMGQDLLSELQIYLYFSGYTIRVNVGAYKGCTISMRGMSNEYVRISSNLRDYASFMNEELWEVNM